jgi:oligopeptide transport system permease protein
VADPAGAAVAAGGPLQVAAARLAQDRATQWAAAALLAVALACLLGPLLSPWGLAEVDPAAFSAAPSRAHWFGTDSNGRDLLVRTLYGGQVSLLVGLLATVVSAVIGVAWGAVAGYAGGRTDALMMRIVDLLFALPFMFLVIVLVVVFGRHFILFFAALGAVEWLTMARIVRGQALSLREREFVQAAQLMGLPPLAIVARHIVPNLRGVVIVYATLTVPNVMLTESFVSFLGLGVQEPMTSWGVLLREGARDMLVAPWQLALPALLLVSTVLSLNVLGEGLRQAFDAEGL